MKTGAALFVATLLLFGSLATRHPYGTYGTETDFYHLYAPDADRIASGRLPANTFQGPGYALVLSLFPDRFTGGKIISVVSGAAVVALAFLLFAKAFGYWTGVGAALLVLVSGRFAEYAISATTDVFALALSLLVLVLLTRGEGQRWTALAGAAAGLAYLTRYNALAVVVAAVAVLLVRRRSRIVMPSRGDGELSGSHSEILRLASHDTVIPSREDDEGSQNGESLQFGDPSPSARLRMTVIPDRQGRLRLAREDVVVFLGAFLLVILPWLLVAPPNANYLNIATRFYPELAGGRTDQDATRALASRFHSFGEVVRHDPARMVRQYPAFAWESVKNLFVMSVVGPGVALLALLGMALALRREPLLPTVAVLQLLLVSLTHWETRYYFLVMVLLAGCAVHAVAWLCRRFHPAAPAAAVALLCVLSAAQSVTYVRRLLHSHPVEVAAACGSFDGRILARKPHLGAICGEEWVFFPPVRSLEELRAWLRANRVDYVAYGRPEAAARPELIALADPRRAPPWLRPVWFSARPRLVIYRPWNL